MVGSTYSTTGISEGGLHKSGICLGYSSLGHKNYRNLNYSLTKSSFYIMVFTEKICKIKAFDAYPTLETCGVFLDNIYHRYQQ